jgi:hypothetical protein
MDGSIQKLGFEDMSPPGITYILFAVKPTKWLDRQSS